MGFLTSYFDFITFNLPKWFKIRWVMSSVIKICLNSYILKDVSSSKHYKFWWETFSVTKVLLRGIYRRSPCFMCSFSFSHSISTSENSVRALKKVGSSSSSSNYPKRGQEDFLANEFFVIIADAVLILSTRLRREKHTCCKGTSRIALTSHTPFCFFQYSIEKFIASFFFVFSF